MNVKFCGNCANEKDQVGCNRCRAGRTPSNWVAGEGYTPPTEADLIRAMNDEEMALSDCIQTPYCSEHSRCRHFETCTACKQDWLSQSAKEE